MRTIIQYFRSAFCAHEWEREETESYLYGPDREVLKHGTKVCATCTKCGWHRKYWKW